MAIQNISRNAFGVREGQSLFDLSIQLCGSVESIFDLANRNVICITDKLIPGYIMKPIDFWNKGVVTYFDNLDVVPASDTDVVVGDGKGTFDNTFDLTFR